MNFEDHTAPPKWKNAAGKRFLGRLSVPVRHYRHLAIRLSSNFDLPGLNPRIGCAILPRFAYREFGPVSQTTMTSYRGLR
jgi:hypothetical protein